MRIGEDGTNIWRRAAVSQGRRIRTTSRSATIRIWRAPTSTACRSTVRCMRIACAFARSEIEIRHAGLADRHEVLERLLDAGIDRRRLIAGQKLVAQALGATHAVERSGGLPLLVCIGIGDRRAV